MRDLKFRIMYKNHRNIWIKNEYTLRDLIEMDGNGFLDDDDIIEQFTGLKDKNGKEIYEGDIVKVDDSGHFPSEECFLGYNAEVRVSTKGGAFTVKNWYGNRILDWDILLYRVEVIGNVHENPELLKGEE